MKQGKNPIKRVKEISGTYIKKLPIGEEWYDNRMKICEDCPFNSKNGAVMSNFNSAVDFILAKQKGVCTNCGCPVARKASLLSEECPKEYWKSLSYSVNKGILKGVEVACLSSDINIHFTESGFVIECGSSYTGEIDVTLLVKTPKAYKITDSTVGCSCTVVKYEQVDNYVTSVNVHISVKTNGNHRKSLNLKCVDHNSKVLLLPFIIDFKKI